MPEVNLPYLVQPLSCVVKLGGGLHSRTGSEVGTGGRVGGVAWRAQDTAVAKRAAMAAVQREWEGGVGGAPHRSVLA